MGSARTSVQGCITEVLCGAAFVAGGALVSLGAAAAIAAYRRSLDADLEPASGAFGAWLWSLMQSAGHLPAIAVAAATLLAFGVALFAVGIAEPDPSRSLLRHGASVLVVGTVGALLVATVVGLTLDPPRLHDDASVLVLLGAGAALMLSAAIGWVFQLHDARIARVAIASEDAAPIFHTNDSTPTIERDRDAVAVEIRVVWGGDLLRVTHLDPPRAFWVGDGDCDLAIDPERLGAARLPVIVSDERGVAVLAPPGATGSIATANGEQSPVEGGARIALTPGVKVSLTLLAGSAGTAYRAAGDDRSAASAPLVLDVALTKAGRTFARSWSVGGRGALVATASVAAITAALLSSAASAPSPQTSSEDDDDPALEEALRERMARILADQIPEAPEPHVSGGTIGLLHRDVNEDPSCRFEADEIGRSNRLLLTCDARRWGATDVRLEGVGANVEGLVVTIAPPQSTPTTGLPPAARVRIASLQVSPGLGAEVAHRALLPIAADMRRCYSDGLRSNASLGGRVVTRFLVGRDGSVSSVYDAGSTLPDRQVISCITHAIEHARAPARPASATTVTLTLALSPLGR